MNRQPHYACPSHCCPVHGCKYGHEDCPVWTRKVQPVYPKNNGCEDCEDLTAGGSMNQPDQLPALPELTLVERLRDTPNWLRNKDQWAKESFASWKDCVLKYDRAPFEAATRIEELEAAIKAERARADALQAEYRERIRLLMDEVDALRKELKS